MSNSLQDQLLKSGLVSEKQAKKSKKSKHKKGQQQRKNGAAADNDAKQLADKAQAEKVARDRELNRQRKEEAERKAVVAQIRQLIEQNRQSREDGEKPYNFTHGTAVKKLYVTNAQHDQLSRGLLAIVLLDEAYELVPAVVAEKIAQRDAETVLVRNDRDQQVDEDDPYADYQIPDDLMW